MAIECDADLPGQRQHSPSDADLHPNQLSCWTGLQAACQCVKLDRLRFRLEMLAVDAALSSTFEEPSASNGVGLWLFSVMHLLQSELDTDAVLESDASGSFEQSLQELVGSLVCIADILAVTLQLLQQPPMQNIQAAAAAAALKQQQAQASAAAAAELMAMWLEAADTFRQARHGTDRMESSTSDPPLPTARMSLAGLSAGAAAAGSRRPAGGSDSSWQAATAAAAALMHPAQTTGQPLGVRSILRRLGLPVLQQADHRHPSELQHPQQQRGPVNVATGIARRPGAERVQPTKSETDYFEAQHPRAPQLSFLFAPGVVSHKDGSIPLTANQLLHLPPYDPPIPLQHMGLSDVQRRQSALAAMQYYCGLVHQRMQQHLPLEECTPGASIPSGYHSAMPPAEWRFNDHNFVTALLHNEQQPGAH